jgi:hypothetical protein
MTKSLFVLVVLVGSIASADIGAYMYNCVLQLSDQNGKDFVSAKHTVSIDQSVAHGGIANYAVVETNASSWTLDYQQPGTAAKMPRFLEGQEFSLLVSTVYTGETKARLFVTVKRTCDGKKLSSSSESWNAFALKEIQSVVHLSTEDCEEPKGSKKHETISLTATCARVK